MRRIAEKHLEDWYASKKRKPLVLRGARQVGKSTLVRLFAQKQKLRLVEVNFETENFKTLVQENLDVESFILECEAKFKFESGPKILLFLDEIQKSPKAFMLLRYFYELRPDIAVIAAGSLLEFIFDNKNISVPVGRIEYLHIGPMSFVEFLWALGDEKLVHALNQKPGQLPVAYFDVLQKRVHEFMFVGGLPEAVAAYADSQAHKKVRQIQENIYQTYIEDFPKYTRSAQYEKIQQVYSRLPHFIGKKLKYSELMPDFQSSQIKPCLELLEKAGVIYRCFHSSAGDLSLVGTEDPRTFKCYDLDIGLLLAKLKIHFSDIMLLPQSNSPLKGFFYEQFVAQHLAFMNKGITKPSLHYWMRDKKNSAAEVDFLTHLSGQIVPIEVKSEKSGTLKSLNQFMGEKKKNLAFRFDASERCLEKENPKKISTFYYEHLSKKPVQFFLYQLHLSQVCILDQI